MNATTYAKPISYVTGTVWVYQDAKRVLGVCHGIGYEITPAPLSRIGFFSFCLPFNTQIPLQRSAHSSQLSVNFLRFSFYPVVVQYL